jgi:hypothetical protein
MSQPGVDKVLKARDADPQAGGKTLRGQVYPGRIHFQEASHGLSAGLIILVHARYDEIRLKSCSFTVYSRLFSCIEPIRSREAAKMASEFLCLLVP